MCEGTLRGFLRDFNLHNAAPLEVNPPLIAINCCAAIYIQWPLASLLAQHLLKHEKPLSDIVIRGEDV